MKNTLRNLPLIGAVLGGLGASICCVLPLLLIMAGIGGAWMSLFAAFDPLRPFFIAITVALLAWAWYRLYRQAPACATGETCAVPNALRRQRILFWTITGILAVLIAFPWYAPWIL